MPTVSQDFFPVSTAHDQTYGTDIDKLAESAPAVDSTSICSFGATGNKNIVIDPFTTNAVDTTPMTDAALDPFGWSVNQLGADGMVSTATAKRIIAAGTWSFQGVLSASPVAALNNVTVRGRVYRVAANGGVRTQLGSELSVNAGLVVVAGTNWSGTIADIGAVTLEADETIQVSFYLNGTGQVGGLSIAFRVGSDGVLNDCRVQVASPGVRTLYLVTLAAATLSFVGAMTKQAGKVFAGTLTSAGAIVRLTSHNMTAALSFVGAVTKATSRELPAASLSFVGAVAKQTARAVAGTLSFSGARSDNSVVISGTTKDSAGVALGSCTVHLFRTSSDVEVAETVSDATTGAYSLRIASSADHYAVAYKAGSPDRAGTTKNDLTGA